MKTVMKDLNGTEEQREKDEDAAVKLICWSDKDGWELGESGGGGDQTSSLLRRKDFFFLTASEDEDKDLLKTGGQELATDRFNSWRKR